ncbi:unnamed protein product [Schistocephalus solidus]|uniref:Cysteine rich secreted protein n=1 Tax=Schistocephalus solidus TaxID=70667 RepID=A0A183SXF3_SCHSO|nr:unnamed protein product [Schistocephalus solidus]
MRLWVRIQRCCVLVHLRCDNCNMGCPGCLDNATYCCAGSSVCYQELKRELLRMYLFVFVIIVVIIIPSSSSSSSSSSASSS